jgi:hypothetical protein
MDIVLLLMKWWQWARELGTGLSLRTSAPTGTYPIRAHMPIRNCHLLPSHLAPFYTLHPLCPLWTNLHLKLSTTIDASSDVKRWHGSGHPEYALDGIDEWSNNDSHHLAWMTSTMMHFLNHISKLCHLCLVTETAWTIATLMTHQLLGRHISTLLGTMSLTHPPKVGLSFRSLFAAMPCHF